MHKKHSLPPCAGIALALLLLVNASARADLLTWGYNWEPSVAKVFANAGGSGYLSLTDEPANSANGSSNTVVTNIHTVSTAPFNTPDIFHQAPITFTLQLTDKATGATGSVKFSGSFSGVIAGNFANIQLAFPTPNATESVTLGGNKYAVALGTYTPPGPPGASNGGALNAFVTVTPSNGGGGGVASAPEPGALTLAGLALPFLGLSGWRKRKALKCV
jgi:hypothetical protein